MSNEYEVSAVIFMNSEEFNNDAFSYQGYTYDVYRIRLTGTSLDDSLPAPYVIKHNGQAMHPEEIIERLGDLDVLEEEERERHRSSYDDYDGDIPF